MELEAFFPYVLVDVPGCTDPLLRLQLVAAAGEFCRETLAWSDTLTPTPLVDGLRSYDLTAPAEAYVVTVRDVWVGNRRLRPVTMNALQDVMPNWVTSASNEPIYYNLASERSTLSVFPTPANVVDQALVVRAAFAPTPSAATLPDFLGQRFIEVMASGAKARLLAMAGTAWFNPPAAAYHQQIFANGMTQARIEEAHDRVQGTVTVRPRSFGF